MKISYNRNEMQNLIDDRESSIFEIPENWQDNDINIKPDKQYTVSKTLSIENLQSTFHAQDMVIKVLWRENWVSEYWLKNSVSHKVSCDNAHNWGNWIRIGDIKLCEHVLAFQQAMRINFDCILSEDSFPIWWLDSFLSEIKPHIKESWNLNYITVKQPILFNFDNWWYMILEPDDGNNKLIIDHQISHNNFWVQRVSLEVTPRVFSYILKARTNAFDNRSKIARIFLDNFWKVPFLESSQKSESFAQLSDINNLLSLEGGKSNRVIEEIMESTDSLLGVNYDNVAFIEWWTIINPNPLFNYKGENIEPVLHWVIDKLWAIGLLWKWSFVGKITTFSTGHKEDVEAMKYLDKNDLLEK